jgi:hypothetical protein
MQEQSLTPLAPRDTGWKKDGKARGIYWRKRSGGSKRWGYYADGTIIGAASRRAAIDGKARATLRKDVGVRTPSTGVRICDLAAEVREAKRRKLREWSFTCFERALDNVLLPELGHLKPAQAGPDRIARLIQDLEEEGLSPSSIRRYLSPLGPIFKLAMRRGLLTSSPLELLLDDERPRGGGIRKHYAWSTAEVSALIAAAEELAHRPPQRRDASHPDSAEGTERERPYRALGRQRAAGVPRPALHLQPPPARACPPRLCPPLQRAEAAPRTRPTSARPAHGALDARRPSAHVAPTRPPRRTHPRIRSRRMRPS